MFYLIDHVADESEPDEERSKEGPEDQLKDTHFFVSLQIFFVSQSFRRENLLELLHETVTSFRSIDNFVLHKHLIRFIGDVFRNIYTLLVSNGI
jgi:hypothetical protein